MKNKIKIIIIFIIIILLIPVIISTYYSTPLKITINNEEYIIYQDTEEINLISYNSNDPINITKKNRFFNTKINDTKLKYDKMISIPHLEINKDNKVTLEIKYITGKTRHITINTMPSIFPEINITGSSNIVGDYYISTIKDNTIFNYQLIINEQGKLEYYKQTENKTYDFKKQINKDNKIRYTYIENNNLYILDEYFNQIKTINNVEQYLYLDDEDIIIYYNQTLYRKDKWELNINLTSMSLDYDHNLLLISGNNILKINIDTSKKIWSIKNKKGTYKLTKKQKITNPKKIISISKNEYCILTDNKQITIKLNPKKKKITKFKTKKTKLTDKQLVSTNNYLTITTKEDITTIKDNNVTIDINYPISSVSKK